MLLLRITGVVLAVLLGLSSAAARQSKESAEKPGNEPPAPKPGDKKPGGEEEPLVIPPTNKNAEAWRRANDRFDKPKPQNAREKRMFRWRIHFANSAPGEYLEQLASMGAFLAFPVELDKKTDEWSYKKISDLRKRPVELLNEDPSSQNLLRWYDNDPEHTAKVLAELKLDIKATHFTVYFPRELEDDFVKAEFEYLKANNIELSKVGETHFRLKLDGKRYVPVVTGTEMLKARGETEPVAPGKPEPQPGEKPPADGKRERPEVLLPVEGKAAVVNAQLFSYIFDRDKAENLLVKVKFGAAQPVFVDVNKIGVMKNATLLRTIRPTRMAVIAASFPLRAQVEEFRKKLRLPSDRAVFEEPSLEKDERALEAFRFLGVVVERRRLDRQGKPLFPDKGQDGYEPLDIVGSYTPLLMMYNLQTEDEDPKLEGVIQNGLLMPYPFSASSNYPSLERELPTIQQSLKKMEEEQKKLPKLTVPTSPNGFDPFGVQPKFAPLIPGLNKGVPGPKPKDGAPVDKRKDYNLLLPEHCLIRVIDVAVEPGERYQYRIRVHMANPNYKRKDVADPRDAEKAELEPKGGSKWFEIPGIVSVPEEMRYYAVDQRMIDGPGYSGAFKDAKVGRDQIALQIHKYLENASPSRSRYLPVGEWSVAERVVVARGEIIDRPIRVDVPIFVEEVDGWRLASTPGAEKNANREPGIDVLFDGVRGRPAVLVDFSGGIMAPVKFKCFSGEQVAEIAAQEVLILSPGGKLLARNASVDAADKERTQTYETWKKRIEEVRKLSEPKGPTQPGNPFDR